MKPPKSTNFTGSASKNVAILSWQDNAINESVYILERKKEGEADCTKIILLKNSNSYTDQGLEFNKFIIIN